MRNRKRITKSIFSFLLVIVFLGSFLTQILVRAEDDSEIKQKANIQKTLQQDPKTKEEFGIIDIAGQQKSGTDRPDPKNTDFGPIYTHYLLKRLITNPYIYDIKSAVTGNNAYSELKFNGTACNPSKTGDFLYHNCNIPTFFGGLKTVIEKQGDIMPISLDFKQAKSIIGAPMDNKEIESGLERFGYDLPTSTYKGEDDVIEVSTATRMLAGFGSWGKVKLGVNSIWNGFTGGIASLVNNFSFNPFKWYSILIKSSETAAGEFLLTILDTSDGNVVMTGAWQRPYLGATQYGSHLMRLTDSEVTLRSNQLTLENLNIDAEKEMLKKPEYKRFKDLEAIGLREMAKDRYPNCINQKEIDEAKSKQIDNFDEAMAQYEKDYAKYIIAKTIWEKATPGLPFPMPEPIKPVKVEIPLCIPPTEEQKFEAWRQHPDTLKEIDNNEFKEIGFQDPLKKCNKEICIIKNYGQYQTLFQSELKQRADKTLFNFEDKFTFNIFKDLLDKYGKKNNNTDPRNEPSHWVCINPNVPIDATREEKLKNSHFLFNGDAIVKGESSISEPCKAWIGKLRDPIQAGPAGATLLQNTITDTRHTSFFKGLNTNNAIGFLQKIGIFAIKLTNQFIDFSYNSINELLDIGGILDAFTTTFKNSIFFPLAIIMVAITTLILFFKFVIGFDEKQFILGLLGLAGVFIVAIALMNNPSKTVKFVDALPHKTDTFLSEVLYKQENAANNDLCLNVSGKRLMMCRIWEAGILKPWLIQQFGTGDINQFSEQKVNQVISDKTKVQIGSPTVNIGKNKYNNWAIYQLDKSVKGNIYQESIVKNDETDRKRELMRLVDLQAGYNYGQGKYSNYWANWTGMNRNSASSAYGLIFGIALLLVIGRFALYKIEVSFALTFQLLLLPFIVLISLLPGGVRKFIDYISGILSLLCKRILISLIILMTLRFITETARTPNINYNIFTLGVVGICIAISLFWKFFSNLIDDISEIKLPGGSGRNFVPEGNTIFHKILQGEDATGIKDIKAIGTEVNNMAKKVLPKKIEDDIRLSKDRFIGKLGSTAGTILAYSTLSKKERAALIKQQNKAINNDPNNLSKKGGLLETIRESNNQIDALYRKRDNKRRRFEGYGFLGDMQDVIRDIDYDFAATLMGQTNSEEVFTLNEAYKLGMELGIVFTKQEIAESPQIQKLYRELAKNMYIQELSSAKIKDLSEDNKDEINIQLRSFSTSTNNLAENLIDLADKRYDLNEDYILNNQSEKVLEGEAVKPELRKYRPLINYQEVNPDNPNFKSVPASKEYTINWNAGLDNKLEEMNIKTNEEIRNEEVNKALNLNKKQYSNAGIQNINLINSEKNISEARLENTTKQLNNLKEHKNKLLETKKILNFTDINSEVIRDKKDNIIDDQIDKLSNKANIQKTKIDTSIDINTTEKAIKHYEILAAKQQRQIDKQNNQLYQVVRTEESYLNNNLDDKIKNRQTEEKVKMQNLLSKQEQKEINSELKRLTHQTNLTDNIKKHLNMTQIKETITNVPEQINNIPVVLENKKQQIIDNTQNKIKSNRDKIVEASNKTISKTISGVKNVSKKPEIYLNKYSAFKQNRIEFKNKLEQQKQNTTNAEQAFRNSIINFNAVVKDIKFKEDPKNE